MNNIPQLGRPFSEFELSCMRRVKDGNRSLWSQLLSAYYGEYLREHGLIRWIDVREPDVYELTAAGERALELAA